ncbi:MAG: DUF1194 domain-containing protein, partial [Hyphomicrobiales bacterium]
MLPNDLKRFFQPIVGVVLVLALATVSPENAKAEQVDLEIVLAVDASGSINRAEYALQMKGYADAFREPSIHTAIRSGPHGKVAVALMLWSDAAFPKHATEWYVLSTPRSAENFARVLETFQGHSGRDRGIGGGGTGIGDGVRYASEMLRKNAFEGVRKVIDVSG